MVLREKKHPFPLIPTSTLLTARSFLFHVLTTLVCTSPQVSMKQIRVSGLSLHRVHFLPSLYACIARVGPTAFSRTHISAWFPPHNYTRISCFIPLLLTFPQCLGNELNHSSHAKKSTSTTLTTQYNPFFFRGIHTITHPFRYPPPHPSIGIQIAV